MHLVFNSSSEPLFAYVDDGLYKLVDINSIIRDHEGAYKLYAGSYEFKETTRGSFYVLVKLSDNKVVKILRLSDKKSELTGIKDLLAEEAEGNTYSVVEFRGTLDWGY